MGGPKTSSVRRAIALAAVVALHVGLLVILLIAPRTGTRGTPTADFTTTFISLPSATPQAINRPRSPTPNESTLLSPVEPPRVPPPRVDVPSDIDTSIEWNSEARRAAGAVTATPHLQEFGSVPEAPSWLGPSQSSPKHQAGEQYRSETGETIVWVNDRCYIVSGVPLLGMPDVLARSIPTRTVCQDDSSPRSDLFKDLPAYKKYHPQ
jgi:hypothetical protein